MTNDDGREETTISVHEFSHMGRLNEFPGNTIQLTYQGYHQSFMVKHGKSPRIAGKK